MPGGEDAGRLRGRQSGGIFRSFKTHRGVIAELAACYEVW